ncbi:MAG: CRISPR-associated helicase Cas3' [Bacillota bacterium]|nr:CRISPR-associated helicase Cas3' [Bacillota bacterium]
MFTAHFRNDGTIQSVKEHNEEVAGICEVNGGKIGLSQISKLAGLLHDAGKEKTEFEEYIEYCRTHPDDFSRRGSVDHSTAGARFAYKMSENAKTVVSRLTAQIAALAVCSHHGGLIDCITPNCKDAFSERVCGKEDICYDESMANFFAEVCSKTEIEDLFEAAAKEIETYWKTIKSFGEEGVFFLHLLTKYVFSCLIDADRDNTYRFMANLPPEKTPDLQPLWRELLSNLEKEISSLPDNTQIDHLRHEISDRCQQAAHGPSGIYRLSVPTGGGKTLSSFRFALEHALEFNKDRIFYIAPYISILDQTALELKKTLKREDALFEHHSNIVREQDERSEVLTVRYSEPIILTTMVQFLNTFFSRETQDLRRMHQMANSVIIIDEVQTLPVRCLYLFNSTLNFLAGFCGATIVLCTATQPSLGDTDVSLNIKPYADIINDDKLFSQFKRVELEDLTGDVVFTEEELADFSFDKMRDKNSMLLVMNTKTTALRLYKALYALNQNLPEDKRYTLFHLSTSMCPAHRIAVLKDMTEKLRTERVICVSTQLIEAGINISFECVVRSLAGFDSIVQAAGRCNRHKERPCGTVYIVQMKKESLSKLPDIKNGADCTGRVLFEFHEDQKRFDGDLLSPAVMDQYYDLYYKRQKNEMGYNIKELNTTVYDLLSRNEKLVTNYKNKTGSRPDILLCQAFQTAAEHFDVIEGAEYSVIVPYSTEGKKLISRLNDNIDIKEKKLLLKKAQQYSVNLFKYEFEKLIADNAVFTVCADTVFALKEENYNEAAGIVYEKGNLDFLMC